MLTLALVAMAALYGGQAQDQITERPDEGRLSVVGRNGVVREICPLKHTSVNADIAGFAARVNVVQTFTNPSSTPIEAVYTFPLPDDAAVDHMRLKVGSRIIDGEIKRREEARRIYEAAKNTGQSAALLDQERPNIFTQSVANVMPGATVQINISYVQVLKYEGGEFEYTFPMVVGPRFTGQAPDPEKIFPPIACPSTRAGSTIDLTVNLDAGARIEGLDSVLHKVIVNHEDPGHATITLQRKGEIPNRDFILHYQTSTNSVQSAFVTSYDAQNGGFFDLILLPPKQPRAEDVAPREMMFVVDQSGSQTGFPIEKSKELTFKLLKTMRPGDTFNVFSFNTSVHSLWQTPQRYTPDHLAEAHGFLDDLKASDGTYLENALRTVMQEPTDPRRLRVILLNTDGFVGDEPEVLKEIKKDRANARIFTFGIGNSVNRYLINAMSAEGKGDSEMVTLASSADAAADRFVQRLRTPVLTDVSVAGQGIDLTDLVPREMPDVFSDRPIVVQGRYENPGHGRIVVSGRVGGEPWSKTLNLAFPAETGEPCVATLWARKKVDDLVDRSYEQPFDPEGPKQIDFQSKIVDVALQFGIMTEFTSFVAVEPRIVNIGGISRTVHVPVDMASGVSYDAFYGSPIVNMPVGMTSTSLSASAGRAVAGAGGPGGFGGGGGIGGGQAFSGANQTVTRSINRSSQSHSSDESLMVVNDQSFERVVDKRLRAKTGKVEIMIFLNKTDVDTIAKLKKLGVTVAETDKDIMVVFGTCEASALKKLAGLTEVVRISPIE